MSNNKSLAIDFDGVIAEYNGWKGIGVFGKPIHGVREALKHLKEEGYSITIHTVRGEKEEIGHYLVKHNIPFDYINNYPYNKAHQSPRKPNVSIYIDDKALHFPGIWSVEFIEKVKNFTPRYKRQSVAADILLKDAAAVFKMKNQDYGNSQKTFGKVMAILFPNGVHLESIQDMNEYGLLTQIVNKLLRYCNLKSKGSPINFESREDTLKDMGIYSFMLMALEREPDE